MSTCIFPSILLKQEKKMSTFVEKGSPGVRSGGGGGRGGGQGNLNQKKGEN